MQTLSAVSRTRGDPLAQYTLTVTGPFRSTALLIILPPNVSGAHNNSKVEILISENPNENQTKTVCKLLIY